jgi:hypothetical protein
MMSSCVKNKFMLLRPHPSNDDTRQGHNSMTDEQVDRGYEKCIVTFIDILGFSNQLEIRPAAELAENLRRFRRFSEGDEECEPQRMDEVRLQSEVRAEVVSDAIVRVRTTETQYQSGPFIWELIDLLHIQIDCIQNDILVRGAMKYDDMHIGWGLEGPIFGRGLSEAYLMEDKEVVYPIIAIDDAVIEWHQTDQYSWREGHDFEDERYHLTSLLTQDEREVWFIDYLRASQGELDGVEDWIAFLEIHRNLIRRELAANHPARVLAKYQWLQTYHDTFMNDVQAEQDPTALSDTFETTWVDVFEQLKV